MTSIISITVEWDRARKLTPIGPKTAAGQLVMPDALTAEVRYANHISAKYTFKLIDGKLRLMAIQAENPLYGLNSVDLINIKIPAIAKEAVKEVNREVLSKLSTTTQEELAQCYMSEYICGGAPRQLLMSMRGWSRSNTNFHIKKLEKAGLIPEDR